MGSIMKLLTLLLVLNVQNYIKSNEGFRSKPYFDSEGFITIGYGRNLQDVGISKKTAQIMLEEDINTCKKQLGEHYPWYLQRKSSAQVVMIDMCFNMGLPRLSKFKNMLAALFAKNYTLASVELLDSPYGRKYKNRAKRNADLLTGGK